ncbi:unnamed protein product [Dovyalis caffra]|uniref:Uncharacterized protein n=1 Tax=Dovyalis caffra TaxID=77055 RepID=A0AAV1RP79_9ROSI|nr:unnamed protein product [Dovyalis caffra]
MGLALLPPPPPPQIPGLPIPGSPQNLIKCWQPLTSIPGCVMEILTSFLGGLEVVTSIASIPTYKPSDRIRQFNDLAEFLGDERAQDARTIWNRPLKTIYIGGCGELKVTKPSLSPSLP